jgi:hypothetical protein
MRILSSDIEALIDACHNLQAFANGLQESPPPNRDPELLKQDINHFRAMAHRVRKVYMILLWASQQKQWDFARICHEDLPQDAAINEAIRLLCPEAITDMN